MAKSSSEITQTNNTQQNTQQENIKPINVYQTQYDAMKDGHPVNIDQRVINVWNEKKQMNALELSQLTPFAVLFVISQSELADYLKRHKLDEIVPYYKAQIEGYGEKESTLLLLGSTRPVYKTPNLAGGMGISNFTIGYERNLTNLKGSATITLPSMDEFEQDFISSVLLSPFNIILCVYGWSHPDILIDLPWTGNLKNGIWKTHLESFNPGWWQMNTMYMYKRTFAIQGNTYSCDLQFVQTWPNVGEPLKIEALKDAKELTSKFSNYKMVTTDTQESKFFTYLNQPTNLLNDIDDINKNYDTSHKDYLRYLINNSWYKGFGNYINSHGSKITDETGTQKSVNDTMIYPLGLVLESIVALNSSTVPLQKNFYAETEGKSELFPSEDVHDEGETSGESSKKKEDQSVEQPTANEVQQQKYNLRNEVPNFIFSVSNGKDLENFELQVNSTFDIPISKPDIDAILKKPEYNQRDLIREILNIVPDLYRVTVQAHPISTKQYKRTSVSDSDQNTVLVDHTINFMEIMLDKKTTEAIKDGKFPNERIELVVDVNAKNSLATDVQLEASNIGLEQLSSPIVWESLFGDKSSIMAESKSGKKKDGDNEGSDDVGDDQKKEVDNQNSKKNNKQTSYLFNIKSAKDKPKQNFKILTHLYENDSWQRGFLIRSLSQVLSVTLHGTCGFLPLQACWIRGLTQGMNGLHVILSVNHTITPENFSTNLRLGNLTTMQEEKWLQSKQPTQTDPTPTTQPINQNTTRPANAPEAPAGFHYNEVGTLVKNT